MRPGKVKLDSTGNLTMVFLDASCYDRDYCSYDDIAFASKLVAHGIITKRQAKWVLQLITKEKRKGRIKGNTPFIEIIRGLMQ